jgi:exonuclease III
MGNLNINNPDVISNVSEQSASGEVKNKKNSDKETLKNLGAKLQLNPKFKITVSQAKNSLLPLTVFHQNIRGLRGKTNELISQLYPHFPHILCISEHHMTHLELKQTFLENYRIGASYCRSSFEKGGVCIFVQGNVRYKKLDLEKHCEDKDLEVCAIKVYFNTRHAYIIAIYRAPSGNFDSFITKLDTILRKLYTVTTEFIICGDINIDYSVDSNRKNQLEALLRTYNLTSIVKFPTRTQKHSATTIDNIFIDVSKMRDYTVCPIINGLSDHDAQSISIHSFTLRPPYKKYKLTRKINEHTINDFLTKLSYENWETVFSTDDVNKMFNSFLDTYLKNFYSSFPLKKVYITQKNNNNKNWITLGILTSCKYKRELFTASRNSNNLDLKTYYKRYCKILSIVIKEAKKINYADKIKKSVNKNKTVWDIVNMETNKTGNNDEINTLNIDGNTISDRQEIANAFNKYFLTVAGNINMKQNAPRSQILDNNTPIQFLTQLFKHPFPNMKLKTVSTKEIEKIIKSLKPKNSTGYDEISTKLIKISASFISSPLTHICNKSLSSGMFPDRMKYAVVKPLFKKGDKSKTSNYRPISILSSFSKILEKVMSNQLHEHLSKHKILASEQFGFRPDSTTNNAIYMLVNEILNALNSKLTVGGIFFDLEKAFDCLNHNILISKLKFYGIHGKTQSWFESYLNNRYMRVKIPEEGSNQPSYSTWDKITDGVPQGSVLGPLLFLIYINDLPGTVNKKAVPILFADDTSIIVKSSELKDFQNNMAMTFNCVNNWFKVNFLSINVEKTHYLQFKTKNKPTCNINIVCNNNLVTALPKIKFLGIYIQDSIKWSCHIDHIIPKLSSACYAMRSIKPIMSLNTLKTIYYSCFNAIISYGLPFWGNSPDAIKVFRIQKRIIRIMLGCKQRVSCRNLFRRLKILPLASQYILSLMLFVVKNKNLFTLNSEHHDTSTRQRHNLYQPISTMTTYQKGIHYMGIKIYNNLPQSIKEVSNKEKKFETSLKQYLHTHSFYCLDEYLQHKLSAN